MKAAVLLALQLASCGLVRGQGPVYVCGVTNSLEPVTIAETDPAGIHLFRAEVKAGYGWSIHYNADRSNVPKALDPFFKTAVEFEPPDGENTTACVNQAGSNSTSFCDLKLATMLDAEGIAQAYNVSPVYALDRSILLFYDMHCTLSARKVRYELILMSLLKNEYPPVITPSLITVNLFKSELVRGKLVYNLAGMATDHDEGLDGQIFYYKILNNTGLFKIRKNSRVKVRRNVTSEDVKDGPLLSFLIQARDRGSPGLTGNMTLTIHVLGLDSGPGAAVGQSAQSDGEKLSYLGFGALGTAGAMAVVVTGSVLGYGLRQRMRK